MTNVSRSTRVRNDEMTIAMTDYHRLLRVSRKWVHQDPPGNRTPMDGNKQYLTDANVDDKKTSLKHTMSRVGRTAEIYLDESRVCASC